MWRCVAFFVAATAMCGLSARADFLYVKIDLSQVYQNIPSMTAGGGPTGREPGAPPMPNGQPALPAVPGEGPFVHATIEMKSKPKFEGKRDENGKEESGGHYFDHNWGKKGYFVFNPTLTPSIIKYIKIVKEPLTKEFDKTFKKELAGAKDPRKFLNAATWAFQRGLTKEFQTTMDELAKIDAKNPVVLNYLRVTDALRKPPTTDDPALKGLINDLTKVDQIKYHAVSSEGGFYVALTNMPSNFDGGVKRRVNRLQETMANFYYWFALNPQLPQPPMPKVRQLLVITSSVEEFYAKHAQWGSQPFAGDGLTPRRDNFILMSWRPVDDVYRLFDANNQELWKKQQISKDWFISGLVWEPDRIPAAASRDPFQIAFTQTLTLVEKAIEDEAELATLTREGTRQLLFASGILPRQVHTPEWIAQGWASYFETPTGALYRSVGLPSWSNLVSFRYLRSKKKLEKPADVLMNVMTDRYYRNAEKSFGELADATQKEHLNDRIREEMDLANSTAWAFVYYLVERRKQPQLLLKYCQELGSLPRDLDLDERRPLEACFAKAFDIADPANPTRVDAAKLTALADAWFAEMAAVSLENPDIQNEYLDLRKMAGKKAAVN